MDHLALVGLDDPALLGQVDQVAELGLGGEGAVAETLAGGERVAQQDQQLGQGAEDPGQAGHHRGGGQRDGFGVLAAQGARRDADDHVADQDHDHGGDGVGAALVAEEVDEEQRGDHRGDHLAAQPEQQEQVEVAGRVGDDGLQAHRAAPPLTDELLRAHPGDAGQRGLRAGDEAADHDEDDEDDGRGQPGVHGCERPCRHDSSSLAWSPNISLCSSGSAWS